MSVLPPRESLPMQLLPQELRASYFSMFDDRLNEGDVSRFQQGAVDRPISSKHH
jgi:hypothetical protein